MLFLFSVSVFCFTGHGVEMLACMSNIAVNRMEKNRTEPHITTPKLAVVLEAGPPSRLGRVNPCPNSVLKRAKTVGRPEAQEGLAFYVLFGQGSEVA